MFNNGKTIMIGLPCGEETMPMKITYVKPFDNIRERDGRTD